MFTKFKKAIDQQMAFMSGYRLLRTSVPKDEMWETYLASFPEGSNPIYRERTEHDCQCCKQFIRAAGSMVAIVNGNLVSIWDIELDGPYGVVAEAMSELVKSYHIADDFIHYEAHLGTDKSHQQDGDNVITWNHFHHKLPSKYVMKKMDIPTHLGKTRTAVVTLTRALDEITNEAVSTVLELIAQNSLYKGIEYQKSLKAFKRLKQKYNIAPEAELFVWEAKVAPQLAGIRNTAIGTLLVNLSADMDLNIAVSKYEAVVAPENYKRPTALITKSMIIKAQAKLEDLGLTPALNRRFATVADLTVANTLFADRDAKQAMNVFEEMSNEIPDKKPTLDKIESVSIDKFMSDILPNVKSIEMMVENKHQHNLMSLIAPAEGNAPNIFKWDNNFSWSYNGEVTDSMKDRVKRAGGNVTGVLRASLQWNEDCKSDTNIDLDIWCIEPNGNKIYYPSQGSKHPSTGVLDVDNTHPRSKVAVENITWSDINKMQEGKYKFIIHNYSYAHCNKGFTAEIEFDGITYTYTYPKTIQGRKTVDLVELEFSKENGIKILKSLPATSASKEIWGIQTNSYQKVSMIIQSPNYWDNQMKGNKHWFFIMANCINPDEARGFYNEFLRNDLTEHRKVFEVLSSKMKTPISTEQVSGIGFSSTKQNSVLIKTTGSFSRIINLTF